MPLLLTLLPSVPPGVALNLKGILPDRLAGRTRREVGSILIEADERPASLGDFFGIDGDSVDDSIELMGDCSQLHWVGAGLRSGRILVRGNVGRHSGEGLIGGRLVVEGNAGDFLAAEMTGGVVRVSGNAGDCVAAALAGSPAGMQGGLVVVEGSAGNFTASRLRRGIVAIGGDCGSGAALEMLAGTLIVAGRLGPQAGMGMRRGSIVALGPAPALGLTFRRGAAWRPTVLALVGSKLTREGFTAARGMHRDRLYRQWHGDILSGGGGEVFTCDDRPLT